jgi:tetratricopeptide (TPR) repeat protein
MGDHLRTAFETWLASFERPVVLIVEDLHWGDVPSVRLLDSALRNLASRSIFVLALARPEVTELFPNLWTDRGLVSIALSPLSKRAAEQLARQALGERTDAAAIASIVERAQGNAFFLEELVRSASRGDAALPDSIFGMLQTRLDALSADTRHVLRAASVFGDSFTADGAFALLGDSISREAVVDQLNDLARAEIVSSAERGAWRFRHALVRDATYATLTEDDRKLGHRLAAELLESTGGAGANPLPLAEHFVRGGVPERAIAHLRAAATKALEGNDIRGAVALSERALALSPSRNDKGVLHATCAEAYRWMGDYAKAAQHGLAAIDELDEGTVAWFFANGEFIAACAYRRDFEGAHPKLSRVRAARASSRDARNAQIVCISRGCTQLLEGGYFDEADAIIRELAQEPADQLDDNARGWVNWLFAMRSLRDGDLATFARNTEACLAAFERIGEVRNTSSQRINLGYAYAELGAFDRAEPLLRRVYRDCERVGIPMVCAYALQNLGNVLRALGRLEEAREQERRAIAIGESIGDRRIEGAARAYGALMMLELGEPEAAEAQCELALRALEKNPPLLGFARSVLARSLLVRGRAEEAVAHSREALAILGDGVEDGETFIRLTHIEALEATGDREGALALALEAERRLRGRAERIHDDALRASFLERVPESKKTLEIAARLRGMEPERST